MSKKKKQLISRAHLAIMGLAITVITVAGFALNSPQSSAKTVTPPIVVDPTVVVTQSDLENDKVTAWQNGKWFIYNDENDTIDNSLSTFVNGPATPPTGNGSVQVSVTGTQRRNVATYQFKGTLLSNISTLQFSTFNPSAGNGGSANRSGYLQFNVDFDGSDTWQKRLVFVPSSNGIVLQDTWQAWDALQNGNAKWVYSGTTWPVTGQPGTTAKTWSQILTDYPNARIRMSDSFMGVRVGEPYANGYTENIDAFKFGTAATTTTFDFEVVQPVTGPVSKDDCKNDGWKTFVNPSFKNQGECVSSVVNKK